MKKLMVLNLATLCVSLGAIAQVKATKTKFAADTQPSVVKAMDIKNSICVPVAALEKKSDNLLIKELATISDDLFKLAMNKIASKYDNFLKARKSFEPGLLDSEFKYAYLESWMDLTSKRVRKLGDYKERLAKIQERLAAFDKKLETLTGADEQLRAVLAGYSSNLQEKIAMTSEWIEISNKLFTNELNKLKSREKKFQKAHVPKA